jgi:hypothetical protein
LLETRLDWMSRAFVIALMLGSGALAGHAQSTPAQNQPPSQQPAPANSNQNPSSTPPKQPESNPFPEDTNNVPVMPSNSTPEVPAGSDNSGSGNSGSDNSAADRLPLPGDATDPVRSPDDAEPASGEREELHSSSSSSSQAGLDKILPSTDNDDQPQGRRRKLAAPPAEHVETSQEDLQVGKYYMESKDWKGALSRFESAMVLAPDEPEVYWGLAEADRHLGNFAEARSYYRKLLDYDPDGPHSKAARKALKDPEVANAKAAPPPDQNPAK